MGKLNVFIDGSWLFKACAPEKAMANRAEWPNRTFPLDFAKLDACLMEHASAHVTSCDALGQRYIATSIFALPDNFDEWPNEYDGVTADDISRTRNGVLARQRFVDSATKAGYS